MSTFSGLNTAYRGLTAARAGLDVVGQNISNASTDGYTRQRVTTSSINAVQPGLFSQGTAIGQGVSIDGYQRIGDAQLDQSVRATASTSGYASVRSGVLSNLETSLNEPGASGLSSQLQGLWSAWGDVSNSPGTAAPASTLLGQAQSVADTIKTGYQSVSSQWSSVRSTVDSQATGLNSDAKQIASLNAQIQQGLATGSSVNELVDKRNTLTEDVAKIAGGTVHANSDGTVDVLIGGNALVSGTDYRTVQVTGSPTLEGAAATPVQLEWTHRPGASVGLDGGTLAGALSVLAPADGNGTGGVLADDLLDRGDAVGHDRRGILLDLGHGPRRDRPERRADLGRRPAERGRGRRSPGRFRLRPALDPRNRHERARSRLGHHRHDHRLAGEDRDRGLRPRHHSRDVGEDPAELHGRRRPGRREREPSSVPARLPGRRPRDDRRRPDARHAHQPHRSRGDRLMLGRVTNQTSTFQAQRSLQYNAARLAQLTDQASSLKAISVPSDDPTATGQSMLVRSQQASNAQYTRNTTDGVGWLSTTDSALGDTTNILNRIRDLTVQGANDGTMSPTSREAIATELTGLKSDLLAAANTTYAGRSVFAGSSDAGAAFTPGATTTDPVTGVTKTAPPAFTGTAGSSVQRRISDGTTVRVDTDGSAVFGTGSDSVFSMVDSIVSDLRSGVSISSRINDIDSRLTAVRGAWGDVGSRESQLTRAQSTLANSQTSLENQRSGIEDVDLSKVILDLKTQEVTYQSALAVTAKVIQPTLMDFLK